MKKFLIFSPSYDENNGGAIVLHKLCSILNDLGHESYLYPFYEVYELNKRSYSKILLKFLRSVLFPWRKKYITNPSLNSSVYSGKDEKHWEDWVVIYPENTFGNPLNAKNVVRWLLHQPGFHTGKIFYGKNELYFKFNGAIQDFTFPGSVTSDKYLKVIHYPLEHYNDHRSGVRSGIAYSLRKNKNKPIQHDLEGSILIDNMPHAEVARIFQSVKTFISYDSYTAYSVFAVLCGCDSVVIPEEGITKEEWYSDPKDRYGLSYGFSDLGNAKKTAHLVKEHVTDEENHSIENVASFVAEIDKCFS